MLPVESRLCRRSAFKRVYSKGRSCAADLVVVYALPSRGEASRFGFSVSRKLGGAVVRNRTKRLLREATRSMLDEIRCGFDVVVIARVKASGAELTELRNDLRMLFRKLGIINALA